jgi:hypothetical protein
VLLRETRQLLLFQRETNLAGAASIAFQQERTRNTPPCGASFQVYFTDVDGKPADPGAFEIVIQDSDIDQNSQYCNVASWTGPVNADFVGRIELSIILGNYVRAFVVSLANPAYLTMQVTSFQGSGGGGTTSKADSGGGAQYVLKAGDTMTGPLTLPGDPTAPLHAATKQYVDGLSVSADEFVLKSGDTMTGPLTLAADPIADLEAATKLYVDNSVPSIPTMPAEGGTGTSVPPTAAQVLVGQDAGIYAPQTMSGDVAITPAGVSTVVGLDVTQGSIASINGLTPAGMGVPVIVSVVSFLNQSSGLSQPLFVMPAGGPTLCEVDIYTVLTQAATTSSQLPLWQLRYNDFELNAQVIMYMTPGGANLAELQAVNPHAGDSNRVGTVTASHAIVNSALPTNIWLADEAYASVGDTPMLYSVYIVVKALA